MTREQVALVVSSVAVSCLNKEECGVKLSGKTALVTGNVTKQADIDKMVETATSTFGSLDILVNNAGIMDNFLTVGEVTDDVW